MMFYSMINIENETYDRKLSPNHAMKLFGLKKCCISNKQYDHNAD